MEDSIFTKIIKAEIPSHRVYEDDRVVAFLDIHPVTEGHVLVVPKVQVQFVWDLEEPDYAALREVARKLAVHLRTTLGVPYVGEQIVGVDVPHAHIHLIPFRTIEEYRHEPDMQAEPDHTALAALAEKLRLA